MGGGCRWVLESRRVRARGPAAREESRRRAEADLAEGRQGWADADIKEAAPEQFDEFDIGKLAAEPGKAS